MAGWGTAVHVCSFGWGETYGATTTVSRVWDGPGVDGFLAIIVKHLQTKGDNDCLCLGDCFS